MLQSCQKSVQYFGKWQWRDSLTILSYYQFNAEFAIGITDVLFQGLLGELCPSSAGSSTKRVHSLIRKWDFVQMQTAYNF